MQSPCLPRFPREEWQRPDCVERMGISRTDEDWRVIKRLRPPQRIISTAEMERRIKRIAPLQAGKMLGALYACMGLIFLPFFRLGRGGRSVCSIVPTISWSSTASPFRRHDVRLGHFYAYHLWRDGFRWRNYCRCALQPFCAVDWRHRGRSRITTSTAGDDKRQMSRQIPSEMSI